MRRPRGMPTVERLGEGFVSQAPPQGSAARRIIVLDCCVDLGIGEWTYRRSKS